MRATFPAVGYYLIKTTALSGLLCAVAQVCAIVFHFENINPVRVHVHASCSRCGRNFAAEPTSGERTEEVVFRATSPLNSRLRTDPQLWQLITASLNFCSWCVPSEQSCLLNASLTRSPLRIRRSSQAHRLGVPEVDCLPRLWTSQVPRSEKETADSSGGLCGNKMPAHHPE